MPDWSTLVRERLRPLDLPEKEANEIVAELAAHLEDLYEEQIRKGLNESEAEEMVMNEVARWRPVAQKIQRAKVKEETMNTRTRHLWLPCLVSLTTAMFSPMLFAFFRLGDLPHHSWLAILPACGGAGAYLSRRAGGARLDCIVSALFPAFALFACGCFILLMSIFSMVRFFALSDFASACKSFTPPGAALLLGALPFLRPRNHETGIVSVLR